MLVTMKELLVRASAENYAIAAPNVGNACEVNAAVEAAEELDAPLILDVHFDNIGPTKVPYPREFADWMRMRCILSPVPIAINEDHGRSYITAIRNIQCGVTSVMADRSSLPLEENIAEVKKVCEAAHAAGISCEAELGHVGKTSNMSDEGDQIDFVYTNVDEAKRFVEETDVDCLAVSIGTAHGAYPKGVVPQLDFDRLKAIKSILGQDYPLVLHGSSGTPIEQLYEACRMGINKVNIATDLSMAAMDNVMNSGGKGNAFALATEGFKNKLKEMIKVYGSNGKAWKE